MNLAPLRSAIGPSEIENKFHGVKILEYWNDGIMGSGKMEKWLALVRLKWFIILLPHFQI